MHIQDPAQKAWIQERIETIRNQPAFTVNGKRAILERLTAAEVFEQFLNKKYTGTKRFGLDGGEAMIPALEQILKRGGHLGLQEVVIGMPPRGIGRGACRERGCRSWDISLVAKYLKKKTN